MCPNAQVQSEQLTAATDHPFEDVMATCHPPGIAGDVTETSSNTQCAFQQHWKKYGMDFTSSVDPGGPPGSQRSKQG